MGDRTLDYIALCVLIFVVLTIVYGIIYIHDIPYEIAKKRNHPHRDAIHTAGWVSLFLMHTIWPFLWIWATLYKPDSGGWGFMSSASGEAGEGGNVAERLQGRIDELELARENMTESFSGQIAQLQDRIAELERRLVDEGEGN